ncbi:hypothetical protein L1987_17067 [Smallanthus sonchifolius]|uniref:Uncharacterized protein n=1 Tax=Smallanthus sonchifolius TaxID=185202 RepID=A0ACB9IYD5_9ASTR|nr:hypothetical protein L1987_17067 [Smallanthus sonchifolius]
MNSEGYSYQRCFRIVYALDRFRSSNREFTKYLTNHDISQLDFSCQTEGDAENSDGFSEPMVWIGIYIAIASFFCILAMAADLLHGFRNKKFWFPCKYFSLNAASITVIAVTMKLTVDLTSAMPSYTDQATKLGSLGFMCTMMANLMPSLASMDNKTLLANVIGLFFLVITMIVNICIQINTTAIGHIRLEIRYHYGYFFAVVAYIYMAMILLLLIIMISSSLTITAFKEILEFKYQVANKISLTDQRLQRIQMSTVEKLRQHVRRYWVMAETGSPQFVMASNPSSTASGLICLISLLMNLFLVLLFTLGGSWEHIADRSPYKWSTTVIFITQSIGAVVGAIAPISRCFSVLNFKLVPKWNRNHCMIFQVEKYWTQKLHEWKQSPIPFLSRSRRSRSVISNSIDIILSLCIGFQKARWCTPPIASRTDDIDEDLSNYVLQVDNDMELTEKTLKDISNSMNSFILKAAKEENDHLLELLEKSTGFKGVEIFDSDHVQPLLSVELVNSWSLPIVTLTCIAVVLPNIPKDTVGSLFESVGEGLLYTHLVEESLNCSSEYVNLRKAGMSLWHEVENKFKWLDNPLAKNVFRGKTTTVIIKWFSDKAKEIVIEINESTTGDLAENPSKTLIAANSMYRITQTILLRYQCNIESITKKQLFAHLSGMIADIFSACFTNIPRVITMRCHESVIEKREASVKVAAKLLGKAMKIIERLETCEVPSMDDGKMAYIDEWRLYLKQSIP